MTAEDLAELLENPTAASPRSRDHLEQCPDCFQRYSQGVMDNLGAAAPGADATRSRALAEAAVRSAAGPAPTRTASMHRRRGRFRTAALAAAGVAVIVAGGIVLTHRETPPRQPAVEELADGSFLLPGVGNATPTPSTVRGGAATSSASDRADILWTRYEARPDDPAPAVEALASLISLGKTALAGDRLGEFQTRHPGNPDGILLQAVLSSQVGEVDKAERLLKNLVRSHSDYADVARFDLGILYRDTGRDHEARSLFRQLADTARNAAVRTRAAREVQRSG